MYHRFGFFFLKFEVRTKKDIDPWSICHLMRRRSPCGNRYIKFNRESFPIQSTRKPDKYKKIAYCYALFLCSLSLCWNVDDVERQRNGLIGLSGLNDPGCRQNCQVVGCRCLNTNGDQDQWWPRPVMTKTNDESTIGQERWFSRSRSKMILVFQYSHVTLLPINIFPSEDLCKNLWCELNPRVCCAYGSVSMFLALKAEYVMS